MLNNLQKKIQALQAFSFKDETVAIIEANKDKLADLERQQLKVGVGSDGNPLKLEGRGYAPFTIKIKRQKGQPTDRIIWNDTGELYSTLQAKVEGDKFRITSNNFKFQEMLRRSGEDAVGLNRASRITFVENVTRPGIMEAYRRKVKNI